MPTARIEYEHAKSRGAMYGGNSNRRGPGVVLPVNYLIIRALLQYDQFFGPDFTIEYPDPLRPPADPAGDRRGLTDRLVSIWLPGPDGRRPRLRRRRPAANRPRVDGHPALSRYFHGDNGAGLAAMHQTGWTALEADLILDPPGQNHRMICHDDPVCEEPTGQGDPPRPVLVITPRPCTAPCSPPPCGQCRGNLRAPAFAVGGPMSGLTLAGTTRP